MILIIFGEAPKNHLEEMDIFAAFKILILFISGCDLDHYTEDARGKILEHKKLVEVCGIFTVHPEDASNLSSV